MARVTSSDVRAILADTQLDDLSPFIKAASAMVDAYLVGQGLPESLLETIEAWLAAHYAAITDKEFRASSSKLGDASDSYGGQYGLGLDFTPYGQQVKALDTTGTLAQAGLKKVAFDVL